MKHYSVIKLVEKTLNFVDSRLVDHGKRVAYLVYTMLKRSGSCSTDQIRKVAVLALLHDIGAYKTEDIDRLFQFETENVWEHSIYGYLFIKNFSPLSDLAPIILFHHANCRELTHLTPSMRGFAQAIHIADRFDILAQASSLKGQDFKNHFDKRQGTKFYSNMLDLLFMEGWENLLTGMDNDNEFYDVLYHGNFTDSDIRAYAQMVALVIDFKSAQTVTHTLAVASVCQFLAINLNLNSEEKDMMYMGAMLHDLGKICTPLKILEKPGRLTENEMEIMKNHVEITETILSGDVDDCCLQLSIRHHEKLNGTGYPRQLKSKDLTMGQRIVAVGDIFSALYGVRTYKDSYSKEKIIAILEDMANQGHIDETIVAVVVKNIDSLIIGVKKVLEPIIHIYDQIQLERVSLSIKTSDYGNVAGTGEITS